MTSRERILTTLDHREPDRCPTYTWWSAPIRDGVMARLGVDTREELENRLGIERWRGVRSESRFPDDYAERVSRFVPERLREREDVKINPKGVVTENGLTIWNPLQEARTLSDIESYPFVEPTWVEPPSEALKAQVNELKEEDAVVTAGSIQPFKAAWSGRRE